MLGRGRCEVQYKISDEFYKHILNFMKSNNMNLNQFSKYVKIDEYLLYKVISKKIRMCCYMSLLEKIAIHTNALKSNIKLGTKQ